MTSTVTSTWALITVTYNSADVLRRFWSDVDLRDGVEWVVVDNASDDDSADVAASLGARVVRLEQNRGFSAANNVALRTTDAMYVAFVNPDVRVDTSTLDRLAEVAGETHGLVTPQLVYGDGTPQPNGRGLPYLAYKLWNRMSPERAAARYYRVAEPGEVVRAEWAIGAAIAGERSVFERLGGWDESFFIYYEDSDLGLRAGALGHATYVVGSVRWEHGWARATTRLSWQPWKREFASAARFYGRYPHLVVPLRTVTSREV